VQSTRQHRSARWLRKLLGPLQIQHRQALMCSLPLPQ